MNQSLTIKLPKHLAEWLSDEAKRAGVTKAAFAREQLERSKTLNQGKKFMRLAGVVDGPPDLSQRKGFHRP